MMTTTARSHMPSNPSTLRRMVASHPVAAFLVMAFAFGWSAMLPLLLSRSGFGVLPISLPGSLSLRCSRSSALRCRPSW